MAKSPYLKPNRLANVIAAIQCMSLNVQSSRSCEQWADIISGNKAEADRWRAVFSEHPEFFRKSTFKDTPDSYALIWRRASPRNFYRKEDRSITHAEYEHMSKDERAFVSRARVPDGEVKTLVDIAIELHSKAREQHIDWRWWVPTAASFVGALLAVLIGLAIDTRPPGHDAPQSRTVPNTELSAQ